jgi:arsenate reductase-like glutaredoxin family protein
MKVVIYRKPTCTTCRQVHAALVANGVDFEAVDDYVDPIPKKKLRELLRTKERLQRTAPRRA